MHTHNWYSNNNIFVFFQMSPLENDTVKLFLELNKQVDTSGILSTLSKVQGPWSFVLWQVYDALFLMLVWGNLYYRLLCSINNTYVLIYFVFVML